MAELDEVVEEADRSAADGDEQDGERGQRVARKGEKREEGAEHDQQAAHHGRPLLDDMAGGAVLPNRLAELVPAHELDELRADHDRDDHRDQAGDQDTDHQPASFARAGATPSSASAREALTSTASPGRSRSRVAATAAVASGTQVSEP